MGCPKKPARRDNTVIDCLLLVVVNVFVFGAAPILTNTCRLHLYILPLIFLSVFIVFRLLLLSREILWNKCTSTNLILKVVKTYSWRSFCWTNFLAIASLGYCLINDENCKFQDLWTEYNFRYSLQDIAMCLPILIMGIYFQWADCPLTESYRLEEGLSFSGGSSMALGYYHGYLKLIFPSLLDRINLYQNRHNITDKQIPEKRLFVLIPSSAFIFDKLRKEADTVEPLEQGLDCHTQDRGMVLRRKYSNSLYKIKDKANMNKTKYYVPLEGATPLITFLETCTHEPQFKDFKPEVVCAFYFTLETLINQDRNLKDSVELIYYDDENDPDIEINELVRKRMKYLKSLRR